MWNIVYFSYFRLSFLSLWVVGLPIGLYLNFYIRPTLGLFGVWIGLLIGVSLDAFFVLCMFLSIDWEKESMLAVARRDRSTFFQTHSNSRSKHRLSHRNQNDHRSRRNRHNVIEHGDEDVVPVNFKDTIGATSLSAGLIPYTEADEIDELESCVRNAASTEVNRGASD